MSKVTETAYARVVPQLGNSNGNPPATQVALAPTQVRRPWRSTLRSVFQALVGLAAVAPLVKVAIEEATGYDLDGVPFVVAALAGAAAVTRIMAVPQVEAWLRRFVPFLAAGASKP